MSLFQPRSRRSSVVDGAPVRSSRGRASALRRYPSSAGRPCGHAKSSGRHCGTTGGQPSESSASWQTEVEADDRIALPEVRMRRGNSTSAFSRFGRSRGQSRPRRRRASAREAHGPGQLAASRKRPTIRVGHRSLGSMSSRRSESCASRADPAQLHAGPRRATCISVREGLSAAQAGRAAEEGTAFVDRTALFKISEATDRPDADGVVAHEAESSS
jgi:hypothetical protein